MTLFPGSITDVRGLKVGHHTDTRRPTGCTVVLCEGGVTCGVDVRGAAPGTRETELLSPLNAVEQVHAVLLAGGSAFGLDAAGGVMRWLDERGVGQVGHVQAPEQRLLGEARRERRQARQVARDLERLVHHLAVAPALDEGRGRARLEAVGARQPGHRLTRGPSSSQTSAGPAATTVGT